MKTYLTDTHSLLWTFIRPKKLGRAARNAFQEIADGEAELLIPVIVVAELIFIVENKPIRADLDLILQKMEESPNVHFLNLTLNTVRRLRGLETIPEMHDRIIVAEALENKAVLITQDETITKSGLVKVIW